MAATRAAHACALPSHPGGGSPATTTVAPALAASSAVPSRRAVVDDDQLVACALLGSHGTDQRADDSRPRPSPARRRPTDGRCVDGSTSGSGRERQSRSQPAVQPAANSAEGDEAGSRVEHRRSLAHRHPRRPRTVTGQGSDAPTGVERRSTGTVLVVQDHEHHAHPPVSTSEQAPPTERPRRQEQERATEEITEVAPGVLRMQLPIDMPGLGHVNCYVLEDGDGFALVDPGLPGPESYDALLDRLRPRRGPAGAGAHGHRDPQPPRPLRRRRPAVRRDRRRDRHATARFRHVVGRATSLDDQPRRPGRAGRRRRGADAVGRVVPARRRGAATCRIRRPTSGACSERIKPRPDRRARRRRDRSRSPAATGWSCTRRATPTTTSACSTRPTASLLSGDHVLPTITPHIGGIDAARRSAAASSSTRSTRWPRSAPDVKVVLPAHGHPFHDLAGAGQGDQGAPRRAPRHRCGGRRRSSAARRRCTELSTAPVLAAVAGARWPTARRTPTSSTSACSARRRSPATASCSSSRSAEPTGGGAQLPVRPQTFAL